GYCVLFDHRMKDTVGLKRDAELVPSRIPAYLRKGGLEELHFLRRYCAKLIYETDLYGGGVPGDSLPDPYADRLTTGTPCQDNPADAFVDVDPRYYAARYLRAWQLQALLDETL